MCTLVHLESVMRLRGAISFPFLNLAVIRSRHCSSGERSPIFLTEWAFLE